MEARDKGERRHVHRIARVALLAVSGGGLGLSAQGCSLNMPLNGGLPTGQWYVEEVGGSYVPEPELVTMNIGEGSINGRLGCNDYSATYENEEGLRIASITTTREVCSEEPVAVDELFPRALARIDDYTVWGGQLFLMHDGRPVIRASR
ncbi:MAG: META domain-containing protein [Pseudomonadota bacterium]